MRWKNLLQNGLESRDPATIGSDPRGASSQLSLNVIIHCIIMSENIEKISGVDTRSSKFLPNVRCAPTGAVEVMLK